MIDYAINNEALRRLDFPMPLINNPYKRGMSVMTESILTKFCPKCKVEKPVSEFARDNHTTTGFRSHCKACGRIYEQDHKEEIAARKKAYRQRPDIKAAVKQYRLDRKEKISKQVKQYYNNHKEKILTLAKQYRQTPNGKVVDKKRRHKRRAQIAGVKYENFNPIKIFERDDYRCQLCGKKTRPDYNCFHSLYPNLDHIVPLNKGGAHTKKNTQCLCRLCNMVKHDTGKGDQLRLFG